MTLAGLWRVLHCDWLIDAGLAPVILKVQLKERAVKARNYHTLSPRTLPENASVYRDVRLPIAIYLSVRCTGNPAASSANPLTHQRDAVSRSGSFSLKQPNQKIIT